jgi:acyl-CoA thioesterase-1
MKKSLIFLFFFFLSACGQSNPPIFDKLARGAVILAFGDSLTYGAGASKSANYPNLLSTISHHKVINAGVSGEITRQGLNRLPVLLDKYKPELLILIHGGNDMLRRVPQQETASNLKQMINQAKRRNIKVVMLGVPAPGLIWLSSAEIYEQVAEELNIPIDLETIPNILGDNSLKSDTLHPNSEGYQLMADNIFNLLVNTGAL